MKAGILVDRIDSSQLSFNITNCVNYISSNMVNIDIIVFTKEPSAPVLTPLFSIMPETEVWGFDAPVISTSLETADTLLQATGPTQKYFYIWDLEWMRIQDFMHRDLSAIYNNENIELIARSKRHRDIINKCWKNPAHVMNDFDHKDLIKVIKND